MSERKVTVTCCRCEKVQYVEVPVERVTVEVRVEVPVLFAEALPTLAEMEAALIREALRRANGSALVAASSIGMGKTTMYRKLKTLDGQRATA